jgi:hypothetical protein
MIVGCASAMPSVQSKRVLSLARPVWPTVTASCHLSWHTTGHPQTSVLCDVCAHLETMVHTNTPTHPRTRHAQLTCQCEATKPVVLDRVCFLLPCLGSLARRAPWRLLRWLQHGLLASASPRHRGLAHVCSSTQPRPSHEHGS